MNFIAIDFETANTYSNSACSIGLVRYTDGKETDSCYSLIHPAKMYFIKEWTEQIHHISYKDVQNKPYFPVVWNTMVLPFINETPDYALVAHNASFDTGVIKGCCNYFGLDIPDFRYFDSLQIARKTWPSMISHKLTDLGKTFNISYNAHDALEDSRTCGLVVCEAAKQLEVNSITELLAKLGLPLMNLKER